MGELLIRPMTASEFQQFRRRGIETYAAEQVRAGNWTAADAHERATRETDDLLPDGIDTPDMLLLVGETAAGEVVGTVWVALTREREPGAWIYDIEVVAEQRGRGYGRELLAAAEQECRRRGAESLGLNVFGGNAVARRLYESAGYELTTLQLRKMLS